MKPLELLSPAKNKEQGMAAISHGADAIYIGASNFGARHAAANSMQDIEELISYAHTYGAKVYATVNTLLYDSELEAAQTLITQLYESGADALIIQDLGILQLSLPPIELHASTQMHNRTQEHVKFLEQVGFKRVILPRELSLEEIRHMRAACSIELESFVQGALCVSYSGRCYLSQYLNEHSGNRGCCSQPCRSTYDLYNAQGQLLIRNKHLLSLRDFSAATHLQQLILSGVTSFKIEGRLKDICYVKNLTAYYRTLIDHLLEGQCNWKQASSGKCHFFFAPDPERTFNRGFTDYFLKARQPMASMDTQKSVGKYIGTTTGMQGRYILLNTKETLTPGDGLCYFDKQGTLQGMYVNQVNGNAFVPNTLQQLPTGTKVWRNKDFAFEKQLQGTTAERKIDLTMTLQETEEGLQLTLCDEDNLSCTVRTACTVAPAKDAQKAREQLLQQLQKLGATPFIPREIQVPEQPIFVPAAILNALRRQATTQLVALRIQHFRPKDSPLPKSHTPYYLKILDYSANITNHHAEKFYHNHEVEQIEWGLEVTKDYRNKALMTTKYCLRYELGQCLMHKCNAHVSPPYQSELYLRNQHQLLQLHFDCKQCEMQIFPCEVTAETFLSTTGTPRKPR